MLLLLVRVEQEEQVVVASCRPRRQVVAKPMERMERIRVSI
jgi:hypothetical protein